MAENTEKLSSLAANNLKKGLSSPAAKITMVIFGFALLIVVAIALAMMRQKSQKAGDSTGSNYSVNTKELSGALTDEKTLKAVESRSDKEADAAAQYNESYGGPFVYQASAAPKLNVKDGFNEDPEGFVKSGQTTEQVMAELRKRSNELTRLQSPSTAIQSNQGSQGGGQYASSGNYGSSGNGGYYNGNSGTGPQGQLAGYGVNQEDFKLIARQLDSLGTNSVSYSSLANGILKASAKGDSDAGTLSRSTPVSDTGGSPVGRSPGEILNAARTGNPAGTNSTLGNGEKKTIAQAGQICAAAPMSAINTDFTVPVFFEVLDCGEMTGVRAKGAVQRGAGDFVITFNQFYPGAKNKFKFSTTVEGVSMNITKDGQAGVSEDIDNHWMTRIGSAALLSLAKTEKQFLNARGTTSIWGGSSSSTTVDGLSSNEKNSMRVAGALEGGMDVITRDANLGVNRPATMKMSANNVIGIQFLTNVEVVYEQ